MNLHELPVELFLKIIGKLSYIEVLNLYLVSKNFKSLIDTNLYSIYLSIDDSKLKNYYLPDLFNYKIFSNIYSGKLRIKKKALIILKYIHKWLEKEIIDLHMDRSMIPESMIQAVYVYLLFLYPNNLKKINNEKILGINPNSHRQLISIIETNIDSELLKYININRITVDGFNIFNTFNFNNPKIYLYYNNFTSKKIYNIKINLNDTKMIKF